MLARTTLSSLALAAMVCALLAIAARSQAAEEWPQFRGPGGQGHADAAGLPLSWSDTENVAWKASVPGLGHSSPVIDGARIWLTTATDDRRLLAIEIDRASGEVVREVVVFQPGEVPPINAKNSYASPSPVVAGGRLYVHYGTLGTACIDTASGDVLWRNQELKLEHKEGPGSSPALWGGLLIIPCDGVDVQYVAALDAQSGNLVWKTDRPGPLPDNPDFCKAYSTPLVIDVAGRPQAVITGADRVLALDPSTGEIIWHAGYSGFSNVPRPVLGQGLVYICTGYMKPELWAIRLGGAGDITSSHVAWKCTRQVPANPSPILVDGRLYMVSDQGIATCLDAATGEQLWTKRLGGNFSASPILADGKLYFCSEDGATSILAPGPDYELLGSNQLPGRIMASPAATGGELYLRTDEHLYRIEKR